MASEWLTMSDREATDGGKPIPSWSSWHREAEAQRARNAKLVAENAELVVLVRYAAAYADSITTELDIGERLSAILAASARLASLTSGGT